MSVCKDFKTLLTGQCILDQMGHREKHNKGLYFAYNQQDAHVHLSEDSMTGNGWRSYGKMVFEHSDTCPSRKFRHRQEQGLPCDPLESQVKVAVCCFILDKDKNLMLTKRPQHLKIFPNVWVLPGGLVEY